MRILIKILLVAGIGFMIGNGWADRIKNLTSIEGVRHNLLLGYGLVVGLTNTGDRNVYTDQSLKSLLNKYSINVPVNTRLNANNVAAVMVESQLPPFARPGQTLDVTVSSIGNARSLRNGALVATPLRGVDGDVYALAQGSLTVSGVRARGLDGSSLMINSTNVGTIANGATVERIVPGHFSDSPTLFFNLSSPDFTTCTRVAEIINKRFGAGTATAIDATSIRVKAPTDSGKRVRFVSTVNELNVVPGTPEARVVINSRTGTVVMSNSVRVLPVAISEGSLVVNVSERPEASQPPPFSGGDTKVLQNSQISIRRQQTALRMLNTGPALNDIVRALNKVGASPGELVQVLQLLKKTGALKAHLIII